MADKGAASGLESMMSDWDRQLTEIDVMRRSRLPSNAEESKWSSFLKKLSPRRNTAAGKLERTKKISEQSFEEVHEPEHLAAKSTPRSDSLSKSVASEAPSGKVLKPIVYSAWVTKLGYTVCNWKRRWATLDGPAITYYAARPRADVLLRPRGQLRLAYFACGDSAELTTVVPVAEGSPIDGAAVAHAALTSSVSVRHCLCFKNAVNGGRLRTFYFAMDNEWSQLMWQSMVLCNLAVFRHTADARTQFVQAATKSLEAKRIKGDRLWSTLREQTKLRFAPPDPETLTKERLLKLATLPLEIADLVAAAANGVDLGVTDETGAGLLAIAARNGNLAAVLFLGLNGADVNQRDLAGNTPLHGAAGNGFSEVCYSLAVLGADRTLANNAGLTAAMVASTSQITVLLSTSTPFDES